MKTTITSLMNKFFILLFSLVSFHVFPQDVQTFYFAKNGLYVENEKDAYLQIERHPLAKKSFELICFTKVMGEWRINPSKNVVTRKKDNQFVSKVEYQRNIIEKSMIEIIDTTESGYIVREYEGDKCLMEAEVKQVLPYIFHGKVIYFPKKENERERITYFYNNLKYKRVKQPKIEDFEIPVNRADQLPRYPGGIEQFVKDILKNTVLPPNANQEDLKETFVLSLTIDSLGQTKNLQIINTEKNYIAEALLEGCNRLTVPWKPASYEGKSTDYTYLLPIQFSVKDEASDLSKDMVLDLSKVVKDADKKPQYPGGEEGLRKYIATVVRYPVIAQQQGIQGKVYVGFIVDTEGAVRNIHIEKGVHPWLDAEALRVVKTLGKWIPGEKDGKKVCVSYTVPISFVSLGVINSVPARSDSRW